MSRLRLPRRLGDGDTAELVEHLGELRGRLVVSLLALVATTGLAYAFHGRIIDSLNSVLPNTVSQPITLSVAEPFMTSLKVSLYAGFLLALPIFFWQFWGFVAPALDRSAQRAVRALVLFSALLLAAGIAFGYKVALPASVNFLTTFDAELYDIQVRASAYYSFALIVILSVGIVFQLPIFVLGLVRLGVTSAARLRRNRRIGYVIVTALAVALPGVDPISTILTLIPLLLLFEGSIWLAVLMERKQRLARAEAASSTAS
jgi:sec-independent protein translocase protein TatC